MKQIVIALLLQSFIAHLCLGIKLGEILNEDSGLKDLIQRTHSFTPGELKEAFNDLDKFRVNSKTKTADLLPVIEKYVGFHKKRIGPTPLVLSGPNPSLLVLGGELLLKLEKLATKSIPECSPTSYNFVRILLNAASSFTSTGAFVQHNAKRYVERCLSDHRKNLEKAPVDRAAVDRIHKMMSKIFEEKYQGQDDRKESTLFLDRLQQLNWPVEQQAVLGKAIYETLAEFGDQNVRDALASGDSKMIRHSYERLLIDSCQSIESAVSPHDSMLLQDFRIAPELFEGNDALVALELAEISFKCKWFWREPSHTFPKLMKYVRRLQTSTVV